MNTRNTKQKELILNILDQNRIHPTMQEIYSLSKEKYPSIGQATIYRNVNKLVEEGKIIRLPGTKDEGCHYDINMTDHNHLICNSCGRIIDIFDSDYNDIIKKIETSNSVSITKSLLILEGICSKCKNKKKNTQIIDII